MCALFVQREIYIIDRIVETDALVDIVVAWLNKQNPHGAKPRTNLCKDKPQKQVRRSVRQS